MMFVLYGVALYCAVLHCIASQPQCLGWRGGAVEPVAQCRHLITGGVTPTPGGATSSQAGVSLVYSTPSQNVSLRLQGLQEEDPGPYLRSVTVQDRQGNNRSHSSKTLELDVWVPPAPPFCHLLGVPRVGTNVTLSCQSPRSKPDALYQWVRPPPSSQVFYAPALAFPSPMRVHRLRLRCELSDFYSS
ncbi:endothelial cell-selective adhesion molecule-like [Glossophaga mutica]